MSNWWWEFRMMLGTKLLRWMQTVLPRDHVDVNVHHGILLLAEGLYKSEHPETLARQERRRKREGGVP